MVARISGDASQLDVAAELAQVVLSLSAVFPYYAYMARAALGLVAVQRGDAAAAQHQYTALESLPSILVHYVSSDRVLGLLAESMGQLDQAETHFRRALAFCERAGYRTEWAWSAYEYATCLHEQDSHDGSIRAASLLEQTLSVVSELDMRPLRERGLMLQQQIKSRLVNAREYPDGLTHREVEVLRLIAGGLSNSDIGQELALSVRTVERHITNIYAKINVRSRTEATAYVFGQGLDS